jgi:hypothetical protein
MAEAENKKKSPPKLNPYVFTVLLFLFGAWCFFDGWISTNPEMEDYKLFNQIASGVLIPWAVYDFFKVRKKMGGR